MAGGGGVCGEGGRGRREGERGEERVVMVVQTVSVQGRTMTVSGDRDKA